MGAIGFLRAAAFSGAKGRPLVVANDKGENDTTVSHAYQKLINLTSTIKTPTARQIAVSRTKTLKRILESITEEIDHNL